VTNVLRVVFLSSSCTYVSSPVVSPCMCAREDKPATWRASESELVAWWVATERKRVRKQIWPYDLLPFIVILSGSMASAMSCAAT
jgi:hypothetical protein